MKDYKLYKCQICGDPYLGDQPPINCPYCGAKQHYFVDAKEFDNPFTQEHPFSDEEKAQFQAALELELGNASFYKQASKVSEGDFYQWLFKSLMKVESEHMSIFAKHLGISKPELIDVEASTDGEANVQESHRREENAIASYKEFAEKATTDRAKQIFSALVEIEEDHLSLES